jgi:hypothetical protein
MEGRGERVSLLCRFCALTKEGAVGFGGGLGGPNSTREVGTGTAGRAGFGVEGPPGGPADGGGADMKVDLYQTA